MGFPSTFNYLRIFGVDDIEKIDILLGCNKALTPTLPGQKYILERKLQKNCLGYDSTIYFLVIGIYLHYVSIQYNLAIIF